MRISNFPEHKSEVQVVTKIQPVIEYVDRVVMHEVKSAPETIVIQKEVDLTSIKEWCRYRIEEQNIAHALLLQDHKDWNDERFQSVATELEMQRRALVALKMQQVIDRRNRLRLLKRLNKEKQKFNLWFLIKNLFKGSK